MQNIAHTPAHAQHIPDGWSFPTLTAAVPPPAAPAGPVTGGGAAATTVTRVRWGRLLPVLAGIGLLAFGIWTITADSSPAPKSNSSSTVSGGGTNEVDITRSVGADDEVGLGDTDSKTSTGDDTAAEGASPADAPVATPPAAPAAGGANRAGGATRGGGARAGTGNRTRAGARAGGGRRAAGRGTRRGVPAGAAAFTGSANGAVGTGGARAGGGTGELPMTGIETWIAGILGVLLLAAGIVVHVGAVRMATTNMLYRRGILLRPTECARMLTEGRASHVRVWLSDVLHRLLEEPAGGSDFVSTRHA